MTMDAYEHSRMRQLEDDNDRLKRELRGAAYNLDEERRKVRSAETKMKHFESQRDEAASYQRQELAEAVAKAEAEAEEKVDELRGTLQEVLRREAVFMGDILGAIHWAGGTREAIVIEVRLMRLVLKNLADEMEKILQCFASEYQRAELRWMWAAVERRILNARSVLRPKY